MSGWDALWERRELPPAGDTGLLAQLMAADGLDSGFAGLPEASWAAGVRRLASAWGLGPGSSVFEVGCGAGAFLYELERLGCVVGGIDRSPALIAKAQEVMPSGAFAVGDASDVEPRPCADAVISFGVFLYFASEAYAEDVLDRMVARSTRVVAVLDLPDAATQVEDLARRQKLAGGARAYAERYAGLEHRYYDRAWVADALRARGLEDVHVEGQSMEGYGNAPFRFNAWGIVPD